jgi:hypothetical protein
LDTVELVRTNKQRGSMAEEQDDREDHSDEIYLALLYHKNKLGVALYDAVQTDMQIGEFFAFQGDIGGILQRSKGLPLLMHVVTLLMLACSPCFL